MSVTLVVILLFMKLGGASEKDHFSTLVWRRKMNGCDVRNVRQSMVDCVWIIEYF